MKCADVYNLFFSPGDVVEIRAYGLSKSSKAWEGWAGGAGVVYGYFDNAKDFGTAAGALEAAKAPGIYFTLNPVVPDLLARAANRLKAATAKSPTTSDKDILKIRWIPIDLDPERPSGISSTKDELTAAVQLRNKIYKDLVKMGAVDCLIPAVSGNGAHLVIHLDQERENNADLVEANTEFMRRILAGIHAKWSTEKVKVDLAVCNPARIWKLYGTTGRKGDDTKDRPHRMSYVEPKFLKKGG